MQTFHQQKRGIHVCVLPFISVTIGMTLSACSGFPTTHPDPAKNNSVNYKNDVKDCAQAYPETADGIYLRRRKACLELKGWR
jgi:hypothetical protein